MYHRPVVLSVQTHHCTAKKILLDIRLVVIYNKIINKYIFI